MRIRWITVAVAVLMGTALRCAAGPFTVYSMSVKNIEQAPYTHSYGFAINDSGVVVGSALTATNAEFAFIYQNGQMITVPGDSGGKPYVAFGINNSGAVVGEIQGGSPANDPIYYEAGQPAFGHLSVALSGLPNPWKMTARAINSSGQIVGRAYGANNLPSPPGPPYCYGTLGVLWLGKTEKPVRLFCLAENTGGALGMDINDSGHNVGYETAGVTPHSMYLWRDRVVTPVPRPAGRPDYLRNHVPIKGRAYGINNVDWVVGQYGGPNVDLDGFAFVWDGVSTYSTDLGALPNGTWSVASKINDGGMVVGTSEVRGPSMNKLTSKAGFIWHPDFGMVQLPALHYFVGNFPARCEATAISEVNASDIVSLTGACAGADGRDHAVLWTVRLRRTA